MSIFKILQIYATVSAVFAAMFGLVIGLMLGWQIGVAVFLVTGGIITVALIVICQPGTPGKPGE